MKRFLGKSVGNDFLPSALGSLSERLGELKTLSPREKAWGLVTMASEAVVAISPRSARWQTWVSVRPSNFDKTNYIMRGGALEAEDERGIRYGSREAVSTLMQGWCMNATKLGPDDLTFKAAVLGLEGSPDNKEPFERACRSWATAHLKGHPWIMCFHYDRPGFPHAHILFRRRDWDSGRALWIGGPSELQALREDFAARLCEAGIEANCTRRATRGMHRPRLGVVQKRLSGPGWMPKAKREAIEAQARRMADGLEGPDPVAAVIREHRRQVFGYAAAFIRELRATGDAGDAELARRLEQYYRDMPPYRSLSELRALDIIREREERAAEPERGTPAEPGRGMER